MGVDARDRSDTSCAIVFKLRGMKRPRLEQVDLVHAGTGAGKCRQHPSPHMPDSNVGMWEECGCAVLIEDRPLPDWAQRGD